MRGGTSMRRGNRTADRPPPDDGGFSMIATVLSLLATAVLTAILLGTMLNTSGTSNGSISNAPGVAEATALQAQQTLSTGLTAADTAAANAGGYGSLQPSTLTASNPSITFVAGPSTNSSTVSMAVVSDVAGPVEAVPRQQAGQQAGKASAGTPEVSRRRREPPRRAEVAEAAARVRPDPVTVGPSRSPTDRRMAHVG